MSSHSIEYTEVIYGKYADEAYTDRLVSLFHQNMYDMREDCRIGKAFNPPNDLNSIKFFWELYNECY